MTSGSARFWAEEEVADLLSDPWNYERFRRRWPGRSYDSFRLKRQALRRDGAIKSPEHPILGVKPSPEPEQREERWLALEGAAATKSTLSPAQDIVPFVIEDDRPIGIAAMGDTHIGAAISYEQLVADLRLIAATDGLYAVHMGDVIDNYKPSGKAASGMYGMVMPDPNEQLDYAVDRLSIARGKWLALCEGNHDAWDFKAAGVARLPDLAEHLGTAFVSEQGATLDVDLSGARYCIGLKHNFAGNSRITKANPQRRMYDEWPWFDGVNLDAVVLAHTHEPMAMYTYRHGRRVLYVRTGTYKIKDSYAAQLGFKPESGVPVLILWPGEREMLLVPDLDRGVELLTMLRA